MQRLSSYINLFAATGAGMIALNFANIEFGWLAPLEFSLVAAAIVGFVAAAALSFGLLVVLGERDPERRLAAERYAFAGAVALLAIILTLDSSVIMISILSSFVAFWILERWLGRSRQLVSDKLGAILAFGVPALGMIFSTGLLGEGYGLVSTILSLFLCNAVSLVLAHIFVLECEDMLNSEESPAAPMSDQRERVDIRI